MYVPGAKLTSIHERTAWVLLPRAFRELGYESALICGEIDGVSTHGLKVIQTGLTVKNPWRPTDGLFRSLLDPLFAFSAIIRLQPEVVIISPTRSSLVTFLPLSIFYHTVTQLRHRRLARMILKGDTDLDFSRFGRFVSIFANLVIVTSTYTFDLVSLEGSSTVDKARELPLIRAEKIVRVPIGHPGQVQMQSYDNSRRKPIILCVARIARVKAQDLLLRAFSMVSRRYPEWSVRLVGPVEDEEMGKELKELSAKYSLQDRVTIVGFVSETRLHQEYDVASVFCLPSLHEAGGSVRHEATEWGLPVVTTDVPCRRDNLENGWLVARRGDYVDLSNKLEELMASEERRREVSRNAQERILSYPDVARMYLRALGLPE
jgi:glycosyltransferase involved in cell wall biosynthesis